LRQEYSRCGKKMMHAWWCWLLWWLTSLLCMWCTNLNKHYFFNESSAQKAIITT
jgi:hypothetical protein